MPTRKIRLHHFLANDVGVDPDVADFTWERGLVVIVWTRINRNYPEDWQLDKAVKLLNERGLDASWEGWEEPHWMKELAIEGDLAAAGFKRRARDLNASIAKLQRIAAPGATPPEANQEGRGQVRDQGLVQDRCHHGVSHPTTPPSLICL